MMRTPALRVLVAAALLFVSPRALLAQEQIAELTFRYWSPTPELVTTVVGLGLGTVDFGEEFALENERFREYRFSIGRRHKARVSRVKFSYVQDAVITRTVTVGGQPQTITAPWNADIQWNLWTVGYEWDVVSSEAGFFGVIGELKHNHLVASMTSPGIGSASTDVTVPVPTVGVIGRAYLGTAASVTAEWTGFKLNRDDWEGKFTDFDLYATINVGRAFGVQGGYRVVDVEYLVDGETGTLKMKGPYFGGQLKF
jgi:hypothetical protein